MDPLQDNQVRRKACEECRRLKLKCDRKFPCHSCMRRGCAAICPSGTFLKGTRSLKTNSLKLHETITEMSSRIVQLEEALASLQTQVSPDPHPLLIDDSVKVPLAPKPAPAPEKVPATEEESDVIDSLGAFSIGEKGEVIFHEATANSEWLLQAHGGSGHSPASVSTEDQGTLSLPPDLVLLSVLFPFPPETVNTQNDDFQSLLPSHDRALSLIEIYFKHSGWCQKPMPREEFMSLIFNECYPNGHPATSLDHVSSHRLSLLFMVYALGVLMDTNRPLCSIEAEEYHTLARACLCVEPVYENSSLHSVQSMLLMIWYYTMAPMRRTSGYRLAIWGVVIRLCQAIGLHHDTSKLNLDPSDANLRELVYWEVMVLDFWQSFVMGRPPSASLSTAHTKRPYDLRAIPEDSEEAAQAAYWAWKHDYTYLFHTVIEQAFRSKGTTYSQILALDQKLRNHPVPKILHWPTNQEEVMRMLAEMDVKLAMQCYHRLVLQESSLLHLHRRFFMQALRANPTDPLQHQFGHSVRAAFASACAASSGFWSIYQVQPLLIRRFPIAWSNGFSAASLLGSLIISTPTCMLASPALKEFDRTLMLFRENEGISIQPANAVSILEDMQRSAYLAMDLHRPIPDLTTERLRGVYPKQSRSHSQSSPHSSNSIQSTPSPMNGNDMSYSPAPQDSPTQMHSPQHHQQQQSLPLRTPPPSQHHTPIPYQWSSSSSTTTSTYSTYPQTYPSPASTTVQIEPDHWRRYATPAATPLGIQAPLPDIDLDVELDLDAIQVDIAPLEVASEHASWDLFMNQFGGTGQVQLQ